MKKKLISLVLVIALILSFAATALAAAPSTMPEDRQVELKAELRGIVADSINSVANLGTGLINNATVLDLVKGAVKSMVGGLLDLGSLGDTAGSALGGLIGGALSGLIGIDLPDSIDLGGIINSIIGNEIINGIITSDFVATVIDKTIDNLFASLDMTLVVDLVVDVLIDKYTDQIWNNGNPTSGVIPIINVQTGNWNNTTESWNTVQIGLWLGGTALLDMRALVLGGDIGDLVSEDAFDLSKLLSIFDLNMILNAVWDAIVDTTVEYFDAFKDQLIAQVKGAIDDIIWQAKDKLATEINSFFCTEVVTADMSFEEMQCAIEAALCDMVAGAKAEMREAIKDAITAKLFALKKQVHSCIHGFIDKLIERCCKCCKGGEDETWGLINIVKLVNDDGEKSVIVDWMVDHNKLAEASILFGDEEGSEDITFELYYSDKDGVKGELADIGRVGFDSMVTFEKHLSPGWYLVHEVLGPIASGIFLQAPDLLIYFNGYAVSDGSGIASIAIPEGTLFTIEQDTSSAIRRPIQVLYTRDDGQTVSYTLREMPKLDLPGAPNGGGYFGTFKFEATADYGEVFTSFCADLGAVGVKGLYAIDEEQHGFTDKQMHNLIAAIDFIYDKYGLDTVDGRALAQLIVWDMILKYTDDPMLAESWVRNSGSLAGTSYKDSYGDIFKVEGNTVTSDWYTGEYRTLIDDILANPEKYADIYDLKVSQAIEGTYVSDAVFLEGIETQRYSAFNRQRQLMILFGEPLPFPNEPNHGADWGLINLWKIVRDDGKKSLIVDWMVSAGYLAEAFELFGDDEGSEDLVFELYFSDEFGVKGELADTGRVGFDNMITFDNPMPPGWYLVHEVMGPLAASIFEPVPDLLIYFDGEAVSGGGIVSPVLDDDTLFTIEQFDRAADRRPIKALYSNDGGLTISKELLTMPKLDLPGSPNGGGAFSTFRFEATAKQTGDVYTSFCADLGAAAVKGDYAIDKSNHGFNDDQLHALTAAIDYIYNEYGLVDDGRALAQLIVWNMILMYSGDPMLSDHWITDTGDLYIDLYGQIVKVEGNNQNNAWYTAEYKALVDDILADADKYVAIYDAKLDAGVEGTFVSGVVFLEGIEVDRYSDFNRQRQLIVLFGDPLSFDNIPKEPGDEFGKINLSKMVLDGDEAVLVVYWMLDNVDYDIVVELLGDEEGTEDILFELYYSDEDGAEGALASMGRVGIDGMITFEDDVPLGWYLVREALGPIAQTIFKDGMPDLLVYFGGYNDDGEIILTGGDGEAVAYYNEPVDIPGAGALKVWAHVELKYDKVYYEPEYGTTKNTTDTLVSWIDGGRLGGITSSNGHTYVNVDVEAACNGGVTFTIADSSPSNRPIPYTYTVTIEGDNMIISFEDLVSIGTLHVMAFSSPPGHTPPGSAYQPENINGTFTIPMPASYGDVVYLFFHIGGGIEWLDHNKIIGWKEVDRQPVCGTYDENLTLAICGPNGYTYLDEDFNGKFILNPADLGEYTVTLSGEGFDPITKTATVVEDSTARVGFRVTVIGPDVGIYP